MDTSVLEELLHVCVITSYYIIVFTKSILELDLLHCECDVAW